MIRRWHYQGFDKYFSCHETSGYIAKPPMEKCWPPSPASLLHMIIVIVIFQWRNSTCESFYQPHSFPLQSCKTLILYLYTSLSVVCSSSPVLQYHHHYHYDKKGHLWVPIRKTTLSQLELKRTSVASVFRLRSFCAGSVTTGPGFLSLLLSLLSEKPWHLPAQVGWH